LAELSIAVQTLGEKVLILGDPGAVSWDGRKIVLLKM